MLVPRAIGPGGPNALFEGGGGVAEGGLDPIDEFAAGADDAGEFILLCAGLALGGGGRGGGAGCELSYVQNNAFQTQMYCKKKKA